MTKSRSYLLAEVVDGEPNAETRIELLEQRGGMGHYKLEPHTGKTHQLRVHMATLGIGILNDPFYPVLLDKAPDDFGRPLQLLARGISFTDPITGEPVEYRSRLPGPVRVAVRVGGPRRDRVLIEPDELKATVPRVVRSPTPASCCGQRLRRAGAQRHDSQWLPPAVNMECQRPGIGRRCAFEHDADDVLQVPVPADLVQLRETAAGVIHCGHLRAGQQPGTSVSSPRKRR